MVNSTTTMISTTYSAEERLFNAIEFNSIFIENFSTNGIQTEMIPRKKSKNPKQKRELRTIANPPDRRRYAIIKVNEAKTVIIPKISTI